MKPLSNKTYDVLKWIAINLIPALCTLILTVGEIWELPYYARIGATVAAIGVFLAAIIGLSKKSYNELNNTGEEGDDL